MRGKGWDGHPALVQTCLVTRGRREATRMVSDKCLHEPRDEVTVVRSRPQRGGAVMLGGKKGWGFSGGEWQGRDTRGVAAL